MATAGWANFEYNGKPYKAASHDLGAASAFLTLEATARVLLVHQMIGIDPDKARGLFGIEGSREPPLAPNQKFDQVAVTSI